MTGETPGYAPTKGNQEKTDREKREKERKGEKQRKKGEKKKQCPWSIIINLHSILKKENYICILAEMLEISRSWLPWIFTSTLSL